MHCKICGRLMSVQNMCSILTFNLHNSLPPPKHPILHQSLKPYYWPIEMCMILKKKDEKHANDHLQVNKICEDHCT